MSEWCLQKSSTTINTTTATLHTTNSICYLTITLKYKQIWYILWCKSKWKFTLFTIIVYSELVFILHLILSIICFYLELISIWMFPLPHLPSMEGACTIVIPSRELGYIANPWVPTDNIDKCFIYFVISIGIVNVVPKVDIITVNSTHGRRTPGQRPPSYCRHGLRAFLTIYSSIPLWFLCTKVNFMAWRCSMLQVFWWQHWEGIANAHYIFRIIIIISCIWPAIYYPLIFFSHHHWLL